MMLCVEITGAAEPLRDLERELRTDPDLRGTRLSRVDSPPGTGEMGFTTEALQWVTDNNELLAALVGAVAGWLARQPQPTRISVKRGNRSVELVSDKVRDPDATTKDLLRALEDVEDV
nr:hypothetical protein [Micromonospora sp. DSM 115978]